MKRIDTTDVPADDILKYGVCGYKSLKRAGFPEKVEWLKKRFKEGLELIALYSQEDGTQGVIEYIPGEYCWRPVDAADHMFIDCLLVGFTRAYQRKGYAWPLLQECESRARAGRMSGVAVVTGKGSFMVGSQIFLGRGYQIVDQAPIG
jgi:hypothetical protein